MYIIKKSFQFSASHQLNGLVDDHPCSRLHGHNYKVTISLQSNSVDEIGFVVDYKELSKFKAIIDSLDHQHLNDLLLFNPTSELLAQYLYREAKQLWSTVNSITVSETDSTSAEYYEQ